jgi:hypothetical protein
MELRQAKRSMVAIQQLPDWIKRIKDLEREVAALRERLDGNDRD